MARVTHGPKTRLIKHSRTLPFIVFIAQNLGLLHFTQPTIFEGEQGCCDSKHLDSTCYFLMPKFVLEVLKNYPYPLIFVFSRGFLPSSPALPQQPK